MLTKSRSGVDIKGGKLMSAIQPIHISETDYVDLTANYGGFCIECGDEAYGVEPDARGYRCESCGAKAVYGAEELLLRGAIHFTDM
jgi:DNA-directed RNA polymerase subunit RPC12/RpoP